MKKSLPGFEEFRTKFLAFAQHKRLLSKPRKRAAEEEEIELPEVPAEDEVAKVGRKVPVEDPDL